MALRLVCTLWIWSGVSPAYVRSRLVTGENYYADQQIDRLIVIAFLASTIEELRLERSRELPREEKRSRLRSWG